MLFNEGNRLKPNFEKMFYSTVRAPEMQYLVVIAEVIIGVVGATPVLNKRRAKAQSKKNAKSQMRKNKKKLFIIRDRYV